MPSGRGRGEDAGERSRLPLGEQAPRAGAVGEEEEEHRHAGPEVVRAGDVSAATPMSPQLYGDPLARRLARRALEYVREVAAGARCATVVKTASRDALTCCV